MSAVEPLVRLEVRRMSAVDLADVMAIERASFSTPWSRSSFEALIGQRYADLWIATLDEAVVGYAVVWYVLDEAELGNIAVESGRRKRGIGSRLLEHVVATARGRGAKRLFLEVRPSNRAALGLYERRGFLPVGQRRRYYRAPVEDARVMCLDLTATG